MKLLILLVLNVLNASCFAATDFTGSFARYTVTNRTGGAEVPSGSSEVKVIGYDSSTNRYSIQITNTNASGEITRKLTSLSAEEIESQKQGGFLHHCAEHGGTLTAPIAVQGESHEACQISSSNVQIFIGAVPFLVLKSVSTRGDGSVITQSLVECSK